MTILSDGEIRAEIDEGILKVTPEPEDIQFQPASLDLRLGTSFRRVMSGHSYLVDPRRSASDRHKTLPLFGAVTVPVGDKYGFRIGPQEFVLATTLEEVALPPGIVGRVDGRSSIGRLGLSVHITAGFIDPGFRGQITLEMYNFNEEHTLVLYPGQRICQISFERMGRSAVRPYGTHKSKYQGQTGATPSRIEEDEENETERTS